MAISAIHFLHDRIVGDLLTHQNAADLTPPRSPQTLAQEQRKHCKCRNSNLRPLQFLRVNRSLQGPWRDAYGIHVMTEFEFAAALPPSDGGKGKSLLRYWPVIREGLKQMRSARAGHAVWKY